MKSPFKFLDSYTKNDREIFFGREREIEELYHRVFESKIMLVYGVSGTGKSSLIHCGLANKFSETDWLPLVIRRGGNIIESLAAGIGSASLTVQQSKFASPSDFKKGVRSLYLDHYKPVFFIFDQFEELFIFGEKEERRNFIQTVKALTESDLQCRFIFVMREEYMASFTEFEKVVPDIFKNRVRIEKMSHSNAIEAIKGPCKVFNINLEEGFAETLLEKLSPGSEDVELTYLQVFLDKVFKIAIIESDQKEQNTFSFNLSQLNKIGNVSDLLGSFLDDQISMMEDPDAAMTILKTFVSGKGTKRPADETDTINNIRSLGKEISSEKVKELIMSFVNLRVLREKDDHGRHELRHDSLAEKIFEKFSTAEKELLEIRQMIENAYQYYLKRKILLSNEDISYISNKDSVLNLNKELREFMDDSRKHQKARLKNFRVLLAISSFAFLILLSSILYTLIKRNKIADSSLLAKQSVSQFKKPIDQVSLALSAWNRFKGEDAKEALLKSFNSAIRSPGNDTNFIKLRKKYLSEFKPASSPIEYASCSKDNRFIYGHTSDSIYIWERNGVLYSRFSIGSSGLVSLLMSDNGEFIGAVNLDSMLYVWDNTGKIRFTHKTGFNSLNLNQIFRFSKENRIITISDDKDAVLLDIDGNILQTFALHKRGVNAVDISEDCKFIATASSDGTINIWYLNSEKKLFDLYNTIVSHTDTVWSVDFAKNSRYVLSTSADGSVVVSDINGQVATVFRSKSSNDIMDEINLGYPFMSEFDESNSGIVIQSYEKESHTGKQFMSAIYIDINYHTVKAGEMKMFGYIVFSPDKKYLAYVYENDASLISRVIFKPDTKVLINNYRLLQIAGQKPFFSTDGNYLYSISGNTIESWYIDIDTICSEIRVLYVKWANYEY
jgi:WD40 repeat protein